MTYPKAIVISAALLAVAILFAAYQPVQSANGQTGGRYMLGGAFADKHGLGAFGIDTKTGEMRLCTFMGRGKNRKDLSCRNLQEKW